MFAVLISLVIFVIAQVGSVPVERGMFGSYFQGDIKLTQDQERSLLKGTGSIRPITPQTGFSSANFRWRRNPHGQVIVPFRISPQEGFTALETETIINEFRVIERSTCIRFVERNNHHDFVDIVNRDGCWSWLGRVGGRQELSLSRRGCLFRGVPTHEIIHALGYDHMHNHSDRDRFVQILWQNIIPEFSFSFDVVDPRFFDNFGTSYDLLSVMHYPRWAFTRNGQDTIVPLDRRFSEKIGAETLSAGDIQRLNRMYQC